MCAHDATNMHSICGAFYAAVVIPEFTANKATLVTTFGRALLTTLRTAVLATAGMSNHTAHYCAIIPAFPCTLESAIDSSNDNPLYATIINSNFASHFSAHLSTFKSTFFPAF